MRAERRRKRARRTTGDAKTIAGRPAFSGQTLRICGLLIALVLVVYAPVWRHAFTEHDDPDYVTRNPEVTAGLTWHGLAWAFTTGHASNWHPLTWLSHMLDVELFGVSPGPHHLVSVVLHVVNTLLVFAVLRRMTGKVGRSAVVAGLFGVHPLHVESVAWVAERKDVLSTLFWLLTLWAYVGYVRRPASTRYLAVLGLFAAGLLAKPMLVTLPFALLLLDFWPLARLATRSGAGERAGEAPLIEPAAALEALREKVPLLALTIASSVVTFVVQRQAGSVASLEELSLARRLPNVATSYVAYVGKTLWPTPLAALYPYPHADAWALWWAGGSAAILLGATVAMVLAARRAPYVAVGWLWYVGTLVPVIGLVHVGRAVMADRYTYIPLLGLFIVLAWGIPDLLARWPSRRVALPVAAALAIGGCAIVASLQVRHWKDTVTLWTHTVSVTDDNFFAQTYLAKALAESGRLDEALVHYREAQRSRPDSAVAQHNLGFTLARLGRVDEAIEHFETALRLNPRLEQSRQALSVLRSLPGRPPGNAR